MKSLLVCLSLALTTSAFAVTLVCPSGTEKGAVIRGVGTDKIKVSLTGFRGMEYEIEKTTEGDCHGRTFFDCYQDGQLMVNIPKSLGSGQRSQGRVWINEDTDDNTSNGRLGDATFCQVR